MPDRVPAKKEDLNAAILRLDAEVETLRQRIDEGHHNWAESASETLHRVKTLTVEAVALASLMFTGATLISHEAKGFLNEFREPERPAAVEPKHSMPEHYPGPGAIEPKAAPPDEPTRELLEALDWREVLVEHLEDAIGKNDVAQAKQLIEDYRLKAPYPRTHAGITFFPSLKKDAI